MARIALRVYNNEINDLIDHGQTEEAVAHCRHILQTYSKHVNTYRLLGKAYLEDQRYGDAADILQRVLSSIPEDFISQVGMSIIREDEGNLDTAIFHMERAFEEQPSNHAIQDELRRLYGRRDGLEPQRIRLTRGALARMYAHGHLYDQAIAELLAALSEDPQRYDLMVLLSNMYFQADKKVEAAETCTKILEKLPYCLDANRLLVTILESSNQENNARTYRARWEQLDPYAAALDTDHTSVEFVSDQSVTVERLEWEPGDYDYRTDPGRAAWASSLGSDFQGNSSLEEIPSDWMSRRGDDQLSTSESLISETPSEPEEKSTSDWLPTPDKDGEDLDLEAPSEPSSSEEAPSTPFGEEETVKPEWMGTPTGIEDKPEESPFGESPFPSEDEPEATPDWMTSSDEDASKPTGELPGEEIPAFMKEAGWETPNDDVEEPPPAFSESIPAEQEKESPPGDVPEWMQDIAPSKEEIVEPTPLSLTEDSTEVGIEEELTPDWQQSIESGDIEPQVDAASISAADEHTTPLEPQVGEKIEGAPSTDDEEGMAWLESLAAKQGVAEEELVTSPEERDEVSPDWITTNKDADQSEAEEGPSMEWLDQLSQEAAQEAVPTLDEEEETPDWLTSEESAEPQPQPEIPVVTEPTARETPSTTEDEEGMAWLESLAAKQGIAEEELVTSPEERDGVLPDWLKTDEGADQRDLQEEPSMEWLDQLSQEAAQEAAPSLDKEEEAPDWLTPEESSESRHQPEIPKEELITSREEEDASSLEWLKSSEDTTQPDIKEEPSVDWLDNLSQGIPIEAQAKPSTERINTAERETDEWLASLGLPDIGASTPPVEPTEDEGTDWLDSLAPIKDISEEEAIPDLGDYSDDSLDWLTQAKEDLKQDFQLDISEERISSDDKPSDEWLEQLSQETDLGSDKGEQIESTEEWLAELDELEEEIAAEEEMGATPEAIEKMDEWIQSLEQPKENGEGIPDIDSEEPLFPSDILEEEPVISFLEEQPEAEPDSETLPSVILEEEIDVKPENQTTPSTIHEDQLDEMTQSETAPSIIPEDQLDAMLKSETTPSIVPEWLQDVAEQRPEPDAIDEPPEWLPSIDESVEDIGDVTPTLPGEWQPESQIEAPQTESKPEPETKPKPKPKPSLDLSKELETASQAIRDADIKKATKIYAKLIKKGKGVEEIIEDIQEALHKHPIDVSLWQALGDALMRADQLQEALDAYSKAEDLLR